LECEAGSVAKPSELARDAEIYAALVIGFAGGGEIQLGERDLAGAILVEDPERVSDDSVVLNLFAVLTAGSAFAGAAGGCGGGAA